jgi:hypothetical protein
MERRAFVKLSAYTALVLSLPLLDSCSKPGDNPLALPLFFSHIADVKTLTEAGLAYRKANRAEDDRAVLAKILSGNESSGDKKAIEAALDDRVKQDFQTNKTVTVSGWVLSITEARQCALFSILNS